MAWCLLFTKQSNGRKFLIKIGMTIIILYVIKGRDIHNYYGKREIAMPTRHDKNLYLFGSIPE